MQTIIKTKKQERMNEAKIKPLKKSVNPNPTNAILQDGVVKINSTQTILLLQMLNSLKTANNALPPSGARFVGKNIKKLMAYNQKSVAQEATLESDFAEKDEKGNDLYWDGVVDSIVPAQKNEETGEVITEGQKIVGTKAYLNKKTNILIDVATGKEIDQQKLGQMRLYIPTEEKLDEYLLKLKELREVENEVHVVKINHDYLEENRVIIPTKMLNPQTNKPIAIDLNSFFEYLVIGGDELPENEG